MAFIAINKDTKERLSIPDIISQDTEDQDALQTRGAIVSILNKGHTIIVQSQTDKDTILGFFVPQTHCHFVIERHKDGVYLYRDNEWMNMSEREFIELACPHISSETLDTIFKYRDERY